MPRKIILSEKYLKSKRGKTSARLNSPEHKAKLKAKWAADRERRIVALGKMIGVSRTRATKIKEATLARTEKSCGICKIVKPLAEFHKNKSSTDGRTSTCKPCSIRKTKEWVSANPAKEKARVKTPNPTYHRQYYKDNGARIRARVKTYRKDNRGKVSILESRKRAGLEHATPRWLNCIQLAQIDEMYEIATARNMQTGVLHHVDHIVPLNGRGVRGLHVPWNLRVITAKENYKKHNRLVEDMS